MITNNVVAGARRVQANTRARTHAPGLYCRTFSRSLHHWGEVYFHTRRRDMRWMTLASRTRSNHSDLWMRRLVGVITDY